MKPISIIVLGTSTPSTIRATLSNLVSGIYPGELQIVLVDVFGRYALTPAELQTLIVQRQPPSSGHRTVVVRPGGGEFGSALMAGLQVAEHATVILMTPGYLYPGTLAAAAAMTTRGRGATLATAEAPAVLDRDWNQKLLLPEPIIAARKTASELPEPLCLVLHRELIARIDAPLPGSSLRDFAAKLAATGQFFVSSAFPWIAAADSTQFPDTRTNWTVAVDPPPPPIDIAVISNGDPGSLPHCLQALADQTQQARRVFVCLDGTDNTEAIDPFLDVLPIEIWSLPADGRDFRAASLRNIALWQSAAPRLLYVDQDMLLEPWTVDAHARYGAEAVCVYGPRRDVPEGIKPRNSTEAAALCADDSAGSIASDQPFILQADPPQDLGLWFDLGTYNASFPVGPTRAAGGFCPATYGRNWEDVELLARLIRIGCQPIRREDLLCYHLDHPRSAHSTTPANWQRLLESLNDPALVFRSPDPGLTANARVLGRSLICG